MVDPDSSLYDGRKKFVSSKFKNTPDCVQDARKGVGQQGGRRHFHRHPQPLAQPDVDLGLSGRQGRYAEKPLSHNIFEGRKLVEAAEKYGRIVQHGTQNRSIQKWADQAQEIAAGKHGKLEVALGTCHKRRGSIGFKNTEKPPASLDFDIWTGPAQKEDFHKNLVHYNWHWFWNYGNGDIGNQGVHQMDIARWMIPGALWPKSVVSVGGRFGYEDQGETANTQLSIFDYGESLLVFDVRGLSGKSNMGVSNKTYFDKNASQKTSKSYDLKGIRNPLADRGKGDIFENFIQAVRSRKTEDLNAHDMKVTYRAVFATWPTLPTNWEKNKASTRRPTLLATTRKPPSTSNA